MGIQGAVLTKNISDIISVLLLHFISKRRKYYDTFWLPFNKESLSHWKIFVETIIPLGGIVSLRFLAYILFDLQSTFLSDLKYTNCQLFLTRIYDI